jgi:hypothetical protein
MKKITTQPIYLSPTLSKGKGVNTASPSIWEGFRMGRKGLVLLILFVVFLPFLWGEGRGLAQTKMPADTEFFYTYGGTNFDEGRDIKETHDKGYIIVGTTSSFGQGNTSVYMIKTDSLGNHKWSCTQGGAQNDHGYAVDTTYDGGFFVAGYSNSFYNGNSFDYSAYYFKTDANGNLLWQKFVDNGAYSFIYGACAMPDSGFVMCGQTYATTDGNADAYLIRVDKNGDTLWTKHYGGPLDEVFNSVCVIKNRIYAVGSNASYPGADSIADGWLVKLDTGGNMLQNTYITYGGHQQETLNGITPYNDSLFTVCGADTHIDSNATTPIVIKYDTSLSINQDIAVQNVFNYVASARYTVLNKIVNISHGSFYIIGTNLGGFGDDGMLFIGFSSGGWFISDSNPTIGGTQNDYGYSGIYTTGGKVIGVGGTLSTQDFCTNTNLGLEDVYLVRFDTDSILKDSIHTTEYNCFADTLFLWQAAIKNYSSNNTVKLFPNPASGNINLFITAANNEQYTANVFSVLGEEVMSLKVNANTATSMDVSDLSNGTYMIKIQDGNQQNISVLKFIISR